jgi:hypothetical protein
VIFRWGFPKEKSSSGPLSKVSEASVSSVCVVWESLESGMMVPASSGSFESVSGRGASPVSALSGEVSCSFEELLLM